MKRFMDRFWSKVDRLGRDECWLWLAGRSGVYGTFRYQGRAQNAHFVAWLLSRGTVPEGMVLLHLCKNILCVNPAHLVPQRPGPKPRFVEERFWEKVSKGDGCWEWTGSLNNGGYGDFHLGGGGRHTLAHRLAWELAHGPIPDGVIVMHLCDNPCCVRPDHLKAGSMADNQRDMAQKGRAGQRGERSPKAKLSDEKVRRIRRMCVDGDTITSIARVFGVARSLVRGVRDGRRWAHVK